MQDRCPQVILLKTFTTLVKKSMGFYHHIQLLATITMKNLQAIKISNDPFLRILNFVVLGHGEKEGTYTLKKLRLRANENVFHIATTVCRASDGLGTTMYHLQPVPV